MSRVRERWVVCVVHDDLAWSYRDPVPGNPRICDLICFYNESVELVVDGEELDRPITPWSSGSPGM